MIEVLSYVQFYSNSKTLLDFSDTLGHILLTDAQTKFK